MLASQQHLVTAVQHGVSASTVNHTATQLVQVSAAVLDASQCGQTRARSIQKLLHVDCERRKDREVFVYMYVGTVYIVPLLPLCVHMYKFPCEKLDSIHMQRESTNSLLLFTAPW